MNDKLSTLQLFVRVAYTSSFTKAGRELGLSQPSASRRISELEEDVGAALFVRSTRAVTLTEAGTDYLTRVEAILSALNEAATPREEPRSCEAIYTLPCRPVSESARLSRE